MNDHGKQLAAIWCRVSTDGQRELSLDSQELAVRKVLEDQGYYSPHQYVLKVDWSSLDLMSNPDFQKLRRWIADGEIKALGTIDRDRLQAQGLQRLIFLSECKDKGVEIVAAQGPPMIDGGEGQLVELALALGKERSVLRAQQGARDGLRDRARLKGLPPNMAKIYGMRWENNRLVPDDNYGDACDIWRMGLAGLKILSIANELTRRGVLTPSGNVGWSANSIRNILKNRAYAGVFEALKTEAVEPKVRKSATYGKSSRRSRPENGRVHLEGLIQQPIVTEKEFEWMLQKLKENQRLALKNTRLRTYGLKGMIRCASCGKNYVGVTVQRRGKEYGYYVCSARWKQSPQGETCRSRSLGLNQIEAAVFDMVVKFLNSPAGFESETRRRMGISKETEASIIRELETLERQQIEEQDAESKAFRLASRGTVSERTFNQELGLIQTRQLWIAEQRQRLEQQLSDVQRYTFDPQHIEILRQRLESKLETASAEDRQYILNALGAKVLVHGDGIWELELQVPLAVHQPERDLQIVNNRPESNYT